MEHINDGMPKEAGKDYYGSACVDVGKTVDDPAAYIATIDPFHGQFQRQISSKIYELQLTYSRNYGYIPHEGQNRPSVFKMDT